MKPNKVMLSKGRGIRNAEAVYAWQATRADAGPHTRQGNLSRCDGHGYQPLTCGAVATVNQGKPTQLIQTKLQRWLKADRPPNIHSAHTLTLHPQTNTRSRKDHNAPHAGVPCPEASKIHSSSPHWCRCVTSTGGRLCVCVCVRA